MGGSQKIVSAKTKTELKKEAQRAISEGKSMGLTSVRLGWDPERVVKTKDGYQITIWVHS